MLSIYVSSYDGAFDLWKNFFNIFYHYWNDCVYPLYLVNNNLPFDYKSIKYVGKRPQVIHTGDEIDWFHRTIKSLKKINSEYILFLLEDYYLSKKQNNDDFEEIINFMRKNNAWYYQLSLNREVSGEKIVPAQDNINYPISLQPAIWSRRKLIEVLENIKGSTPWDFENYFKVLYENGTGAKIEGAYYDTRDILGYKNGVLRGKWIPSTIRFYKKNGIIIDLGKRSMLSKWGELKFNCASIVSCKLDKEKKEIVKNFLSKLGINYLG